MSQELLALLPLTVGIFLLAGTIKGTVGIGLPTAGIGLMTQVIDPHIAIVLLVFPLLLSNLWQVYRIGAPLQTIRQIAPMIVVMMVTLWATTSVTAQVSQAALMTFIGLSIVLFATVQLFLKPPPLPDRLERAGQIVTGFACGIMGGLTAIWAPPLVAYLLARRVDKDTFVRTTGIVFGAGGVPLAFGFWQQGLLTGSLAAMSAMLVIPTIAGFAIGETLRRRIKADRFQTVVLVIFLIMGLNILRRAWVM